MVAISSPAFTGRVDAKLNQKMNVEVRVEGVDRRQFALVMETCWATPVSDPDYSLRWDLVIKEKIIAFLQLTLTFLKAFCFAH